MGLLAITAKGLLIFTSLPEYWIPIRDGPALGRQQLRS